MHTAYDALFWCLICQGGEHLYYHNSLPHNYRHQNHQMTSVPSDLSPKDIENLRALYSKKSEENPPPKVLQPRTYDALTIQQKTKDERRDILVKEHDALDRSVNYDKGKLLFPLAFSLGLLDEKLTNSAEAWRRISDIVRQRKKAAANLSEQSKTCIFRNGNLSTYHHLEHALWGYFKDLDDNTEFNCRFVGDFATAALNRMDGLPGLNSSYRSIVGLKENAIPSYIWRKRFVDRLRFRNKRQNGVDGPVNEAHALREPIPLWKAIQGFTPDRIFNADQTSCRMVDPIPNRATTRKSVYTTDRASENYTFMFATNADGSTKITLHCYCQWDDTDWWGDTQRWLNPQRCAAKPATVKRLDKEGRGLCGELTKSIQKARATMKRREVSLGKAELMQLDAKTKAEKTKANARFGVCKQALDEYTAILDKLEKEKADIVGAYVTEKQAVFRNPEPFQDKPFTALCSDNEVFADKFLKVPLIKAQSESTKGVARLVTFTQMKAPWMAEKKLAAERALTPAKHREAAFGDDGEHLTGPNGLLNCRVVHQTKGYMDTRVMLHWLVNFLAETGATEENPVLLIVDSVQFHDHARHIIGSWPEMKGIQIHFLNKNSTSYTQPMNLGIISWVKRRAQFLETRYLNKAAARSSGKPAELTQLHQVNFLSQAWDECPATEIRNSFRKSPAFHYHPSINCTDIAPAQDLLQQEAVEQEIDGVVESPINNANEAAEVEEVEEEEVGWEEGTQQETRISPSLPSQEIQDNVSESAVVPFGSGLPTEASIEGFNEMPWDHLFPGGEEALVKSINELHAHNNDEKVKARRALNLNKKKKRKLNTAVAHRGSEKPSSSSSSASGSPDPSFNLSLGSVSALTTATDVSIEEASAEAPTQLLTCSTPVQQPRSFNFLPPITPMSCGAPAAPPALQIPPSERPPRMLRQEQRGHVTEVVIAGRPAVIVTVITTEWAADGTRTVTSKDFPPQFLTREDVLFNL